MLKGHTGAQKGDLSIAGHHTVRDMIRCDCLDAQVQNARHKLEGRHPSAILIAELTPKHSGTKHWAALQVPTLSAVLPAPLLLLLLPFECGSTLAMIGSEWAAVDSSDSFYCHFLVCIQSYLLALLLILLLFDCSSTLQCMTWY